MISSFLWVMGRSGLNLILTGLFKTFFIFLRLFMILHTNLKPKNIQSGGVIPVHKPGPNPFLIAAEKKHAQVMTDKNSGSLAKRISGGAVMNAMEIDSVFSQALDSQLYWCQHLVPF